MLRARWGTPECEKWASSIPTPFSPRATLFGMNRNFSAGASPAASAGKPSRLTPTLAAMMATNTIIASGPGTGRRRLSDRRTISAKLIVNGSVRLGFHEQVFDSGVQPGEEFVPDGDVRCCRENLRAVGFHCLQRGDLTDEVREESRADDDLEAQHNAARCRQPQRSPPPAQATDSGEGRRIEDCRGVENRSVGAEQPRQHWTNDEQHTECPASKNPYRSQRAPQALDPGQGPLQCFVAAPRPAPGRDEDPAKRLEQGAEEEVSTGEGERVVAERRCEAPAACFRRGATGEERAA